jgi:hypothetical protein
MARFDQLVARMAEQNAAISEEKVAVDVNAILAETAEKRHRGLQKCAAPIVRECYTSAKSSAGWSAGSGPAL